jgi:hypothetical protein
VPEDILDHPDLQDDAWEKRFKQQRRRHYWRRNRSRLVIVLALVAVAVAGVVYVARLPARPPAPAAQSPVDSAATTTPVTMQTGVKVDLRQPFVATPAAGWADGEAGLSAPQGAALNGFTAAKVTEMLGAVRVAIAAAYLDRRVVQDNNLGPLVALFAPDVRKAIQGDPRYYLRIKPGFRLLDLPPKVSGKLTVEAGKAGELVVNAAYAIAYAFHTDEPDDLHDAMDIVSVMRVEERYVYREGKNFARAGWGLWPGQKSSFFYSIACTAMDAGFLAPAYSERRQTLDGPATNDLGKAFDPNTPLPTGDTCHT